MDKIKFVMTNTSDIVTEVCREALEAKGVTVMVCDKNGTAALETLLAVHPQACLLDALALNIENILSGHPVPTRGPERRTSFFCK